ncbi:MAG: SpoIIE family protein phosphatase [Candidatus Velthaea sp.]
MTKTIAAGSRVLVVDDTESTRYVLSTWLRRAGHDVVEARTGAEGLSIVNTQPIDLIVLDVNLPDMTGFAVCELIKADEFLTTMPVLHVSATSVQAEARSEGLRRGADAFLTQPVEPEVLIATVGALLRAASAHRTAVGLAHLLRRLNEATLAINQGLTLEQLAVTIAREASALFETPAFLAIALEEQALSSRAVPGGRVQLEARDATDVDAICRAVAMHLPIPDEAFTSNRYMSATIDEAGGQRGVLLIERPEVALAEADIVLVQYARAASTAIKNVRTFDIERRIALALQENLLPDAVSNVVGVDVVARYRASAEHAEVGGDFYEVFPLVDDRVGIAIGDVVGHSLEAAMVMAQLRTGIRAYLLEGHGPAATLERLNRLLLQFHSDSTATVCCAIYDRRTGTCELANAGHLSPLLRSAHSVRALPNGGTLLGVEAVGTTSYTFDFAGDDVLLLFTDGLIERRGESIDVGLERLTKVLLRHDVRDLDDLCDRVLQQVGPESILDDIALVAIRPAQQ